MQVSVADAKNKLTELIKAVEDGETVTICRREVPVMDVVRTKRGNGKEKGARHVERQDPDSRSGLVEAYDR